MKKLTPLLAIFLLLATQAQARPVVIELFTSEACSSCPPAEELLTQLKKSDPDLLPLSFHVTYWDSPAWKDKYGIEAATDRQSWYVGLQHSDSVYTPEAIVDGTAQMIGSDRGDVTSAIANAKTSQPTDVKISVTGSTMITVNIGPGSPAPAALWLFGFDSQHTTQIGGGENGGATLIETNVVRSITPLGNWNGIFVTYTMPRPAGDHMAVILQTPTGQILGAAAN